MTTFIVTYNPTKWHWDPAERTAAVRETAAGRPAADSWSTGNRKSGVVPHHGRVFLLQQGSGPRGVVASGTFVSEVAQGPHWDGTPGKVANYADVEWDRVVEEGDLLSLSDIEAVVGGVDWSRIQAGGVILPGPADQVLERLWADHSGASSGAGTGVPGRARGPSWQADPEKRRAVEDHAQAMLEQHYRHAGWAVKDTRYGNPYDAVATKNGQTLYLEAKGTETDGVTVKVTSGEVEFARTHPGQCVLGTVSEIRFRDDGVVEPASGRLTTHQWDPDGGFLRPTAYDWRPPDTTI